MWILWKTPHLRRCQTAQLAIKSGFEWIGQFKSGEVWDIGSQRNLNLLNLLNQRLNSGWKSHKPPKQFGYDSSDEGKKHSSDGKMCRKLKKRRWTSIQMSFSSCSRLFKHVNIFKINTFETRFSFFSCIIPRASPSVLTYSE